MLAQGQLIANVETIVWAIPAPGITLDELILKLNHQGFSVLEIDLDNNRIKVLHTVDCAEES